MIYLKGGKKKQQQQTSQRNGKPKSLGMAPFFGDNVVTMWLLEVPVSNNLVTVY